MYFEFQVLDELKSRDTSILDNISSYVTDRHRYNYDDKANTLENNSSVKTNYENNLSLVENSLRQNEKIVKVPVKFLDGPENELFLLHIPESKLNNSVIESILKIEVLKDYKNIAKNITISTMEKFDEILTKPTEKLKSDLSNVSTRKNIKRAQVKGRRTKNNNDSKLSNENASKVINLVLKNNNLALNDILRDENFKSAINESQSFVYDEKHLSSNYSRPYDNQDESYRTNNATANEKRRKIYKQRVLIHRGSTKHQRPTNDSSKVTWVMKKVVVKRIKKPQQLVSTAVDLNDDTDFISQHPYLA